MALPSAPVSQTAGLPIPAATLNGYKTNLDFLRAVPCGRIRSTTGVAPGAYSAITMDAEDFDTDNAHSTVTNTSRVTPPTVGYYLFMGNGSFAIGDATARRYCKFRLNGTTDYNEFVVHSSSAGGGPSVATTTLIHLNGTTDYVEFFIGEDSTGAPALATSAQGQPCIQWFWIGS